MAYTLGTMISRVQNDLDDTGFSSSILTQYANDTQREVFNNRYFRFMQDTENYTLVASQASIGTLPTDFQQAIDLRLTTGGLEKVLTPISIEEFDAMYPDSSTAPDGIPEVWYIYGNTINVFPEPASTYTAVLRYYKTPAELVNTTDVPEIPEAFQEVLALGMLKRALKYNDSYDQSLFNNNEYADLLDVMTKRYSPQRSGTTIMSVNKRRRF